MKNIPRISYSKIMMAGLLMLAAVLTGVNSRRVMALEEFIDDEEKHWTDISLAISKWPLNTFSIFRVSELNFDENKIKVVFGVPADIDWQPREIILAWQSRAERFAYKDFEKLFTDEATGNYEVITRLNMGGGGILTDESEMEIELPMVRGELRTRLNDYNLLYMIQSATGDVIRPQLLNLSGCMLDITEGEVCRMFYRDPLPDMGASSGQMGYFAVRYRDVSDEVEGDEEVSFTEKNEDMITESDEKKTDGDIKIDVIREDVAENDIKYSSGDIFKTVDNTVNETSKGVDNTAFGTNKVVNKVTNEIVSGANNSIGVNVANNADSNTKSELSSDQENKIDEVTKRIEKYEAEKKGNVSAGDIEVPRLGMTAREIDYKWLFLPILGLVLMLYWWFLVPIWKKHEKSAKKSKKSVDNI